MLQQPRFILLLHPHLAHHPADRRTIEVEELGNLGLCLLTRAYPRDRLLLPFGRQLEPSAADRLLLGLATFAISFALPTFAQQTNTSAATSTATPSTTTTPSTRGSTLPNAFEIICRPLPVYELPAIDNRFEVGTIMRTISFWHQIALQLFILG